jgi:hypothetical protein
MAGNYGRQRLGNRQDYVRMDQLLSLGERRTGKSGH